MMFAILHPLLTKWKEDVDEERVFEIMVSILEKYIISIALGGIISRADAVLLEAKPTYQIRNGDGQVTCEKCPPGTFVEKHCNSSHPTICGSCPELHYTQYWNYLRKCRYCNVFCVEHQYEKQQCNSTHNRVCECKPGYYLEFEFCLEHKECPAGSGVTKAGTAFQDTICEQCSDGFFSSTPSSSEPCKAHTNCDEGLVVNVPGNRYHNTLCTPCKKYIGSSINKTECNEALIQFVAYQRIPVKRLARFLNLLQIQNARKIRKQEKLEDKNMMFVTLHPLLMKWKEDVNEERVFEKMVSVLEKAKMKNISKNVKERFRRWPVQLSSLETNGDFVGELGP
ncbi:tumor necrosis factor receptor superfamily member 6B-like isoform X2 [Hypanus sabinus]|uniref:tumor necrosis factor receptor superfamily member 6B-like isoform X2 n=1 Tax=Hypanus sabinus TaxID=79690 RepID=UPI0028C4CFC6|nr:tumor necrosis factor receptor superfamily member 6B-like isoform X2 [Hypanus sabinus]